jgi:hypothetical protein
MPRGVGMKQKFRTWALFALLVVAGAVAAGAVAGLGPSSALQTTSSTTVSTVTTTTTTDTTTTTTTPAPRKITICHHTKHKSTGATKHVTIRINRSAWKAHQRHGDSLGACTTVAAKKFHSRAAHVKKFHKKKR